jgi:phosphoribosyl-ATP pyrophosphohydrolase/phosphoribosyl-AMP cyclohydrolase
MNLNWTKQDNIIPAIVQHADTLQVLMLGYMNQEAFTKTIETKRVCFFSRSKQRLWQKGESSGNYLDVVSIEKDCDDDTLLIMAKPQGPTCHLETTSCFGDTDAPGVGFLAKLEQIIDQRYIDRPKGSYTSELFNAGIDRLAQKVGEEGVEVVIAAKNDDDIALKGEVADLWFHSLTLLRARSIKFSDIIDTLRERHSRQH